nr:MAG TPA: hypothetical protein [Caudoviricetes sp.]
MSRFLQIRNFHVPLSAVSRAFWGKALSVNFDVFWDVLPLVRIKLG